MCGKPTLQGNTGFPQENEVALRLLLSAECRISIEECRDLDNNFAGFLRIAAFRVFRVFCGDLHNLAPDLMHKRTAENAETRKARTLSVPCIFCRPGTFGLERLTLNVKRPRERGNNAEADSLERQARHLDERRTEWALTRAAQDRNQAWK